MKKFKLISADQSIMGKNKNFFLAFIDRFSKYPSVEVFDRANAQKLLKFLQEQVL